MKNDKKDLLDGILHYANIAEKLNKPDAIASFPEHIQDVAIEFQKLWMLPLSCYPSPKRHKSMFAQWVKEFESLYDLMGDRYKAILSRAFLDYNSGSRFIVSHPSAIRNLLISTMATMERERRELEMANLPVHKKLADKAELLKIAKELKDL